MARDLHFTCLSIFLFVVGRIPHVKTHVREPQKCALAVLGRPRQSCFREGLEPACVMQYHHDHDHVFEA